MKELAIFMMMVLSASLGWSQDNSDEDPDSMPYFPGCGQHETGSQEKRTCAEKALMKYITEELRMPDDAKELGIEGLVYISFTIAEGGEVKDAVIVKDIGGGCGESAKNVVESMPRWEPALKEGQPVPIQLSIPIKFSFSGPEKGHKGYFIKWGDIAGLSVRESELNQLAENHPELLDVNGELVEIHELVLYLQKGRKEMTLRNRENLSAEMKKQIKKLSFGDRIVLTVSCQKEGRFYDVVKEFEVKA